MRNIQCDAGRVDIDALLSEQEPVTCRRDKQPQTWWNLTGEIVKIKWKKLTGDKLVARKVLNDVGWWSCYLCLHTFCWLKGPPGLCYFQFSLVIAPTEATNYVEEDLSVARLLKKLPSFYGTRWYIIVFRSLSLDCIIIYIYIYIYLLHIVYFLFILTPVLILLYRPCFVFQSNVFPSGF